MSQIVGKYVVECLEHVKKSEKILNTLMYKKKQRNMYECPRKIQQCPDKIQCMIEIQVEM